MNHFKAVGRAALVSGFTLIGQPAGADDALLKAPLVACASGKTVIGGVNACGKIWKIGSGEVTLNADGKSSTISLWHGWSSGSYVCRDAIGHAFVAAAELFDHALADSLA